MTKYKECRINGHDWQSTDNDAILVCSRCQTQRTDIGDTRSYQFPPGYTLDDVLATYNNCETLEHDWRMFDAMIADGIARQRLTCTRCLAKMVRRMSATTGELISETIVPPVPWPDD